MPIVGSRSGTLASLLVVVLVSACGKGPTTPSAALAFSLTAAANPIAGGPCTGCGSGSTDREVSVSVTIRETGGAAGTVSSVAMVLRENGTNAVIAQGAFNAAAVAQLAGSSQLTANGSLSVPCSVHYAVSEQGKPATLTCTVSVTDARGTVASHDLVVAVTGT